MATLANYPIVSQLTSIRPNPDPDPNGSYDCVEASVGSAILWYQHKTQWDTTVNPDLMKIAAYGLTYTGGTAASRLIPFCQQLGFNLYPINGTNAELVQKAHQLIQGNQPAIFTEPDPYSSNPGDSHVCVFFGEGIGTLTALDPYIARAITRTDSQWQSVLLFNQLWTLVPTSQQEGGLPLLQLTDPMGQFFTQTDASHWHCVPTNVDLIYGHLAFYRQYQGIFGLPRTNEIYLAQMPNTAIVVYERAIACYDPSKAYDNPPGAGTVYLMHTDNGGIGQQIIAKPLLAALQTQIDALNKQIIGLNAEIAGNPSATTVEELQTQVQQLRANISSYQAAVKQVDGIIHPLAQS